MHQTLGFSGRVAAYFQAASITPLLALLALLLGAFAVLVTPREEEPQINVTMANVLIPFPGAAVADVEHMVAGPAEQVLGQIAGVEHVMSVSRPGLAVITVQFKVGVPRTEALVRLHDTVRTNADWLPRGLGVLDPNGRPVLRQVRLGRTEGKNIEVLSGLMPGERVVSDPQAAAKAR